MYIHIIAVQGTSPQLLHVQVESAVPVRGLVTPFSAADRMVAIKYIIDYNGVLKH